ncbi:MAG: hypothetical protein AAF909_09665 [Pseudomonadota bacterium]
MALVAEQVDVTIEERRARLETARGVSAARVMMWRFVQRRGGSFK